MARRTLAGRASWKGGGEKSAEGRRGESEKGMWKEAVMQLCMAMAADGSDMAKGGRKLS